MTKILKIDIESTQIKKSTQDMRIVGVIYPFHASGCVPKVAFFFDPPYRFQKKLSDFLAFLVGL